MVRNFLSHFEHGLVEDGLHQRHASTTPSTCFCTGLDLSDCRTSSTLDVLNHITLSHIVTGTDLGTVIAT